MVLVYFVGNLKSQFIRQNLELLEKDCLVAKFDLSEHATSFLQAPSYLVKAFMEYGCVKSSDAVWIWFADYPAIPFVIMAKLFGKPVYVNVGGWEVCNDPGMGYGNQVSIIRGAATRWILRNSNCICTSEAYRKRILALVPEANATVIPGWVDSSEFHPSPQKFGVLTAYCDYPLSYHIKGIGVFEQATAGLEATVLKNVSHRTLISALQNAKVYCQLSRTESFGMTVLEAMACGCVPVVSDRDALPELIGDAGVVVPYGDAEKTRSGILKAMQMNGNAAITRAQRYNCENARLETRRLLCSQR
jgi:glycosyltransferase involved in cell wall biosynthesis